ncbi:MAG TPA: O-methyltransferase [Solirubrobacterales bacterium]|jgi:predicted O-methyltransferase YrrM|nr:O-methyltransferase [Solirubrobacterales bacterium]
MGPRGNILRVDQETFSAVDQFIAETIVAEDEGLRGAVEAAEAAGLPSIQVSPPQGRLLQLLVRLVGAKRILEFGTLGGYSAILMARALPEEGRLITLEAEAEYAEVARRSIDAAGVGGKVEIRVGPALEALPDLDGEEPFDLVFIDADKVNTPNYFASALDRTRPGGLIVADNVVRDGTLADPNGDEASQAQRRLHEMLAEEPRVSATTVQTVGVKGYDGFLIALVEPKSA